MEQQFRIGTTYYPEQYPRERWAEDIRLMIEAGINVVRMTESSWDLLEPEDGKFDFDWMDDFINLVGDAGIEVILTTPMEASPAWLRQKEPNVVITDEFGHLHGGRGRHCHNNAAFLYHAERLVTRMAEHYANHSAVIGWEIDNELRAETCYCNECAIAFRTWLQQRYGSLESVNEAWGTIFWSQLYTSWEQVAPPSKDQLIPSVSQILDYQRFTSDTTVTYLNRQVAIIRRLAPRHFITHNTPGVHRNLDVTKLSKELDFISWDSYPQVDSDSFDTCFSHDFFRGVTQKNFWIMEQKNGYFNYSDYNLAIEPGLVRMWSYQDISRGADAVLFYNWRSTRFSYEQNPNGLLRHDGSPRRAYYEVKQLTKELAAFGEDLLGTEVEAPVGIIHSMDVLWAFNAHKQYPSFEYRKHIKSYYNALLRLGITADVIDPMMDLARYKIVIAPSLMMVSEDIKDHFQRYVEAGGCLIIGARSGMKTWTDVTIDTPWPGLLAQLTGITIDEFEVLPDHMSNTITYKDKDYPVNVWVDIIEPNTAETVSTYKKKFYAGKTAISKNKYGKGVVYYVGVMGNDDFLKTFLMDVADAHQVKHRQAQPGIFITRRFKDNQTYTFYINVNPEPTIVTVEEEGLDVIIGTRVTNEAVIQGLDVLIVKSPRV